MAASWSVPGSLCRAQALHSPFNYPCLFVCDCTEQFVLQLTCLCEKAAPAQPLQP